MSAWDDAGPVVVVRNLHPYDSHQSNQAVVTFGKQVSIDFPNTQSGGICGAGAELPSAIVIAHAGEHCRVWFEE